jgi:hypothetical protein
MGGLLLGQIDATAGEDLELRVRRLVRQLDAPQLAERESAEQALVELGPNVLGLLPQDLEGVSAEIAQRVGRIRQKLQRAMAESAGQASDVTLHGEMTVAEAAAKIEEQTGNKIVLRLPRAGPGEPTGAKLTLDFDEVPFWKALDQVFDRAGLGVYAYGEEKAIYGVPRPEGQTPRTDRASYSGPLRFEVVAVEAIRDLRNPRNQSLRLTLEVSWEPRLAPVSLMQRMDDLEPVDENGNPLDVQTAQAVSEVNVIPDSTAVSLELPLELPPRDVKQIARLEGTLTALLPGKVETFRFEDLEEAEDVEKRMAGVTVMLERVRKNRSVWEVRMLVRFDQAHGALESHRNWIYDNEVYLEPPDGESVVWATFETTRQTESEVGVAYYFAVDGPLTGYTLVYKTPALILSKAFDYQIQNIPLP